MKRAWLLLLIIMIGCGGYVHEKGAELSAGALEAASSPSGQVQIATAASAAVAGAGQALPNAVGGAVDAAGKHAQAAVAGLVASSRPELIDLVTQLVQALIDKAPALREALFGPGFKADMSEASAGALEPLNATLGSLKADVAAERQKVETLAIVVGVGLGLGCLFLAWHAAESRRHRRVMERLLTRLVRKELEA